MFDHVKFGVSDYAASKAFFLKALEPRGVSVVSEGSPTYGIELSSKSKASLCLYQTEEKPAHLDLAFTAENRQQVEAFYRAALEAGGKDNGAPGLCPEYHANYYAAFVIGPDGHNIEVVRPRVRGKPLTRGLTTRSRGRPQAGFAHLRPPLMSNVRWIRAFSSLELGLGQRLSLPCKFRV